MKYKKNKLRLNEIASAIQGFYVSVKFGLVLIYRLEDYRKKYSSIFLRKNMFNFCFEKHVPSQVFIGFSVDNLETTPSNFLSKFVSETLYLTLVCVVSVFFFFLLFFFSFYWYFPWQTLTIHRIAGMGEGIIVFLVSHIHPLTNIYLVHGDFYHLFFASIFNYETDSWWDFFSLEICILFAFSLIQSSRSYWLIHFKVTLWGFELISNYRSSITKRTP